MNAPVLPRINLTPHSRVPLDDFATAQLQRHIALQGACNVRDIGGYLTFDGRRTRWRMLLRADSLHNLTADDERQLLDGAVRTVIDLRVRAELMVSPNVFEQSSRVRYKHVPLMRASDVVVGGRLPHSLEDFYELILFRCQPQIKAVFDAVTAAGAFPLIVHCTLGKDRTGLIVALLLSALNVPDAIIAEDYALTGQCVAPLLDGLRSRVASAGQDMQWFERMLDCRPAIMLHTLHSLQERYGTVTCYLRAIGVTDEQINHLRAELLA